FVFQAEDGIRDRNVTGVQTCALPIFVHQDYQGNGLQKIMASLIMQELSKTSHSYKYICATVAPDNIPSLKDKFAQNMEIKALVTIYDEKQRYVFAKKLIDV